MSGESVTTAVRSIRSVPDIIVAACPSTTTSQDNTYVQIALPSQCNLYYACSIQCLSRLPYSFNSDLRRPTDHFASLALDLLGDNHDEYHFVLPNQLYLRKESGAMVSLMGISFSRSCLHHSLFSMRYLDVTLD